jgi:hypothetical protein
MTMMCSYFSPNKSVQDITHEIINILNMYEYPEIPFDIFGQKEELLREFERLQSIVFFLQERFDLWYIARKLEKWRFYDNEFSQEVLLSLKSSHIDQIPILSIWNEYGLNETYYDKLFNLFIVDLRKIIVALANWICFLFSLECKIYGEQYAHYSVKEIAREIRNIF